MTRTAEEVVEEIPFDRAPDHHDGPPTHEYCPECHVCKDCTEKAIAQALTAFADERVREDRLTYVRFLDEENQKELDELSEPMSCGHAEAEMQPSDEGPDMCIACYFQQEAVEKARAEALEEAAKIAEIAKIDRNCLTTGAITKVIAEAIRALKEKA